MDCRPRLTRSIHPWFRIRVYLLLDRLPTKAIELHLTGFWNQSRPSRGTLFRIIQVQPPQREGSPIRHPGDAPLRCIAPAWIRRQNRLDSFQTQLGLGAIPVFNRCTRIGLITDLPSRFLTLNTGLSSALGDPPQNRKTKLQSIDKLFRSSGLCSFQAFSDLHVPEVRNTRKIEMWKLGSEF